ncbi:MAG: zinc-ribbon domain-containing protein [Eggerthellaceae bacterium]
MNTPLQHPQTEGKRFCPQCGSQLKPEAQFCSHCGKQLGDRLVTSTPAEKKFSIEKLPFDLQKDKELKGIVSEKPQAMSVASMVLSALAILAAFAPWLNIPLLSVANAFGASISSSYSPLSLLTTLVGYEEYFSSDEYSQLLLVSFLLMIAWLVGIACLAGGMYKTFKSQKNMLAIGGAAADLILLFICIAFVTTLNSEIGFSICSVGSGAYFATLCAVGAAITAYMNQKKQG